MLGSIGWGSYKVLTKQTIIPKNSMPESPTKVQPPFRLSELGVGFFPKENITPVYRVANTTTTDGVIFKTVFLSTGQLIEKEKALSPGKNISLCGVTNTRSGILQVRVYRSKEDLIHAENGDLPFNKVTLSEIKPENGFLSLGDSIYHIPSGIETGQGPCIDDAVFYSQQWKLLHDSLFTLQSL